MKDFRDLEVWKKAHMVALETYRATRKLPSSEGFGMTYQLRRAATSVASKIAEGCGRDSNVEFGIELRRAKAASSELEYLLLLARDLEYFGAEEHEHLTEQVVEVRKTISGLLRKL